MRVKYSLCFVLFCLPSLARADAISLVFLTPIAGGKVQGTGTFSVDANRKFAKIVMKVTDAGTGKVISTTPGTVLMGTTQWASISNALGAGRFLVQAVLTTTDLMGQNPVDTPSNIMPWNQ